MGRMTFVNLPVKDLGRSIEFFSQLGFGFDPQFTDDTASSMVISDDSYVMLITEDRFKDFTKKTIADAHATTEVLVALSAESREEVDDLVARALAAGGAPANDPLEDGFMYGWSFEDPDGHIWELIYMDEEALER
jgi:uncharacterized protein